MRYLWKLSVFIGFLMTLYLLDKPEVTKQQYTDLKSEFNRSPASSSDFQKADPPSQEALENEKNTESEKSSTDHFESLTSDYFLKKSQDYYFKNARVVHTWEKQDPSRKNLRTKVVLFEPEKKNKYALLRMEQKEEGGAFPLYMVADHVMVTLKEDASETEFEALMEDLGASVRRIQPKSQVFLVEFNGEEKGQFERVLRELNKRHDLIRFAEPDYLVSNF